MPVIGTKAQVYRGTAHHTTGGLTRSQILRVRSSDGTYRYVSKKKHNKARASPWIKAVSRARRELLRKHPSLKGKFIPINKGDAGRKLYKLALEIYN